MKKKHIIAFGEPLIEITEIDSQPNNAIIGVGGDVLNFSVYCHRLSQKYLPQQYYHVTFAALLGDDHLTRYITKLIHDESLIADGIFIAEKQSSGLYAIKNTELGEREFAYWRQQSPSRLMFSQQWASIFSNILLKADMVYFSGISLAILYPDGLEYFLKFCKKLKDNNIIIAFDTNYRPHLWAEYYSHEEVKTIFKQIFTLSDIILPSYDDIDQLYGFTIDETLAFFADYDYTTIIVKNGASNVYYRDHHTDWQCVTIEPLRNVIDTTAAGDSFGAGFIAGYMQGLSLKDSINLGQDIAAKVIGYKGAIIPKNYQGL